MKINVEVDISPAEIKEIFEGNMEAVQRSLMEMFMRQMSQLKSPDPGVVEFWQSMSEKSAAMFEQYQQAMMAGSGAKPKK